MAARSQAFRANPQHFAAFRAKWFGVRCVPAPLWKAAIFLFGPKRRGDASHSKADAKGDENRKSSASSRTFRNLAHEHFGNSAGAALVGLAQMRNR